MLGGASGTVDLSQYLVNFNSSDWANQANQYLGSALNQGMGYGEKYNQAAIDTQQAYQQQANQAQMGGYNMAQAVQAPQRFAGYQALDAYQDTLGLARPEVGSYQLANSLEQTAKQQLPNQPLLATPQQQQIAGQFNQGLLGPVQQGI